MKRRKKDTETRNKREWKNDERTNERTDSLMHAWMDG